ncbi:MAG TPA: hypothetical protein VH877_11610 [Polyangia bacterium]|nr:hypothetical protein [Polyangia bacterium]
MFVIGVDNEVYRLRYNEHIAAGNHKLQHPYEFLRQKNFYAQVLTHVVDVNLEKLTPKDEEAGCDTGYLIDLRRLYFVEQAKQPKPFEERIVQRSKSTHFAAPRAPAERKYDHMEGVDIPLFKGEFCPIPDEDLLKPVQPNLYIVVPQNLKDPGQGTPSIYFVSKDRYTKDEDILAPFPDALRLQRYFGRPGFQVGVIIDEDRPLLGLNSACYVANLRSLAVLDELRNENACLKKQLKP